MDSISALRLSVGKQSTQLWIGITPDSLRASNPAYISSVSKCAEFNRSEDPLQHNTGNNYLTVQETVTKIFFVDITRTVTVLYCYNVGLLK